MKSLTPLAVAFLVVVCGLVSTISATQPGFCSLPPETGRCRAAFRRYHFDPATQTCKTFIFGGCDGNDNNFRSEAECRLTCICSQEQDSGTNIQGQRCRNSRYFYYDSSTSTCSAFRYRGCGGNGNRFPSKRSCNNDCAQAKCLLPAYTGPCKAAFTRYFYNSISRQCEEFIYGGCRGNENNFGNVHLCRSSCQYPMSFLSLNTNPFGSFFNYFSYGD